MSRLRRRRPTEPTMSAACAIRGRSRSAGWAISASTSPDLEPGPRFLFAVAGLSHHRHARLLQGPRPRGAGQADAGPAHRLHEPQFRPSRLPAGAQVAGRDLRRRCRVARRHGEPDHLAGRHDGRGLRRRRLLPRAPGRDPPRRPRHAGQQLAHLHSRSRRPHGRALLRHGADRLGRPLQARVDVLPRLPRDARAAADVGSAGSARGHRQGHRHRRRQRHRRQDRRGIHRRGREAAAALQGDEHRADEPVRAPMSALRRPSIPRRWASSAPRP